MAEKARKSGNIGVKTGGQTVKVEDGEEKCDGWRYFSEVSYYHSGTLHPKPTGGERPVTGKNFLLPFARALGIT